MASRGDGQGSARAVDEPLRSIDHHLKVLVKRRLLEGRAGPDGALYTLTTEGRSLAWINTVAAESVLLLSFLDAAWAAIGAVPETVAFRSQWGVYPVDEIGLIEASKTVDACIKRFEEIVRESEVRSRPAGGKPLRTLVAVTSAGDPDDGRGARQ